MTEREFHEAIIDDLFFEQESKVLAQLYKHGLFRTIFVVCRSLIFTGERVESVDDSIVSGSSIAVVFFENEFQAIARAQRYVRVDKVIRLTLTSLPIIRAELGLASMVSELLLFMAAVVRRKGFRYVGRSSIPLLGWLLCKTFMTKLRGKSAVTVITTNMQHPASIGVHWAARLSGQSSVFLEHATTPTLVFNNRGYDLFYVNFEHTRRMMISRGAAPESIHVMRNVGYPAHRTRQATVRSVGVCINDLDTVESVADVTSVLRLHGFEISYRLHDADPRLNHFRNLAESLGIGFSSARVSRIEEFIAGVDLVVAGNSNVVADALIACKPVVYYWAGQDEMFDYYGFVKHYGLPCARTKQSLNLVLSELTGQSQAC